MKQKYSYQILATLLLVLCSAVVRADHGDVESANSGAPDLKWNYQSFSALAAYSANEWSQYNKGYEQHPDFGKVFQYTPKKGYIEVLERRTESSKYYVDPAHPTRFIQQEGYAPLHFRRGKQLITIDPRIRPVSAGLYEAGNQWEPVGFDVAARASYIKTPDGKLSFNKWTLSGLRDGKEEILAEADWSGLTAGDDGCYIKNVFPGIDAEMRMVRGGIKTNFIIRENRFPAYAQLTFTDHPDAGSLITPVFEDGAQQDHIGRLLLQQGGKTLAQVEKGVLYPEKDLAAAIKVPYHIEAGAIGIRLDAAMLNDWLRSGAVVLDPLVSGSATLALASISGSKYNVSCNFDSACTYGLTVATPPAAKLTDVLWTFGVVAAAPCGMENGRWRFTSGTCGTGFWRCTASGVGACAATISEWATLGSCMPAPACTSSNVDFTLHFYRSCLGDTGCNSTCIGAVVPWTMAIQGRTVEFVGDSLTYNTNDSVCKGTTVTLGATPTNGIPPYTAVNWSMNRTGTPSLGTGATMAVSFPNAGSYKVYASCQDACGVTALDSQTIYVDSPANPVVVSPLKYCKDATTAVPLTATGTSLKWYATASSTPDLGGAPTPATGTVTTLSYFVSQTSYLGCEGARAQINININPLPAAPVASPASYDYCIGATATALTATAASASDTLKWYYLSAGGASSVSITPATGTATTTNYYVSQKDINGCEGSRTAIPVTVHALPAAPAVSSSPVTYCKEAVAVPLTATATSASDTLKWYTVASGGSPVTSITPATTDTGTFTFYVSQKTMYGCEGPRANIKVRVNQLGGAPIVTSPVGYCEGAATVALTATSSAPTDTLLWFNAATGGSPSYTAPTPVATTASTTVYYVAQKNTLGCTGHRTPVTVYVSPVIPAFSILTADSMLCLGDTTKLYLNLGKNDSMTTPIVANNQQNGIMFDVEARKGITINSFEINTYTVTNAPFAVYYKEGTHMGAENFATEWKLLGTVNITGTENTYTKIPLPIHVTIPAGHTAAFYLTHTTGNLIHYNNGTALGAVVMLDSNIKVLEGTAKQYPFSNNYTPRRFEGRIHYSNVTALWSTAATTDTITVSPAAPTNYWARITNSAGCKNTDTIKVQVDPLPVAPAVVSPKHICLGTTPVALTATASSATDTLKWFTASGTLLAAAPIPGTSAVGTTDYYVSQRSAAGCDGPRSLIRVIIDTVSAAPVAVTPVKYCQLATAVALSATTATPGDTLKWYNSADVLLPGVPTPSTTATGTFTWYVRQKNAAGCFSARTEITVTVNPTSPAPVATTSYIYCQNATATTLTATTATAADTLKWYNSGGTLLAAAPTPSTTAAGTFTWTVSQKNNFGCESPKTTISVLVNPTSAAPVATTSYTYCQDATATTLTATAASAADTLRWYNSTGTLLGAAPTPVTTTPGTFTWTVSQKNNFGCESPKTTITVLVNPKPVAPTATTSYIYCQNATATTLTATKTGATDTLRWYNSGGTLLAAAPTPSTATTGTFTWTVSQKTAAGCEGPKTTISVLVNPTPAAPVATTTYTYCQGKPATTLTATAATATDTLKWYDASSTLLAGAPTPSTVTAGTFTWTVSQKNTFGCESPKTTITVTVNTTPAAPTVTTPLNLCIDGPSSALTATGTSLKWYNAVTAGTLYATTPVPSTTALGTTDYYVSQTTALGCEGPRAKLQAVVNPRPAAPGVITPIELCIGVPATALTATGINLKWYAAATGGTGSSTATVPATATTGSTDYYVSQTSVVGCEGARSAIRANVHPSPALNIIPLHAPAFAYCPGEKITLKAIAPTATSMQWYQDAVTVAGATFDTLVANTNGYYAMLVKDIYGCMKRDSVYVFKDTLPAPTLLPKDVQICEGVDIMLYAAPTTTGYYFVWMKDGMTMGLPSTTTYTPVNLSGNYSIIVTDIYNCTSTTNTATVSTYPVMLKPVVTRTGSVLRVTAPYSTYQWYRNGKPIAGARSNTYTVTFDGLYHVVVSDPFGCISTSDDTEIAKLSIPGQVMQEIRLYPNPTSGSVQIDAPVTVNVVVTNVTGQVVLRANEARSVDIGDLADGMYLFHITDAEGVKLLVEKVHKVSSK